MSAIHELSAVQLANEIKNRSISIVEVSTAFIERVKYANPKINALQQFEPDRILEEARNADKKLSISPTTGRLTGIPFSVKDTCHVENFIVSKGCRALYNEPSRYDATVVARLKAEGAIVYGLTNVPELCLSYETDNLIYGRSNNPYDLNRTPGGSSGGQAAIISVCGVPIGIGSDAGGSVRQPAHYCGICAHKPTQGLVPFTGNFPVDGAGIGAQLVTYGPMARFAEDLSLIMEIIAGEDNVDPHVARSSFKKPSELDLKSLRVCYFLDNPLDKGKDPTGDTIKAVERVIQQLRPYVSNVEEVIPIFFKDVYRLHYETFMLGGDGGESLRRFFELNKHDEISPLVKCFLNLASECSFSTMELRQRLVEVEKFRFSMMKFMENYDVLISPVTPTPAYHHGQTYENIYDLGYVIGPNLTGWPATVVPCMISREGLPIGVQIVSKPWNDHFCLAIAQKIQSILQFYPCPAD